MTHNAKFELAEKVEVLSCAKFYGLETGLIERIETHMSWVFLTPQFAYKLKKPVHRPYLDFSTLTAREYYCREELKLNRRLAASVYLDVVPIRRGLDGQLRMNDPLRMKSSAGDIVDYLVKMVRLPAEKMLDHKLRTRTLAPRDIRSLLLKMTDFYRSAYKVELLADHYLDRLADAINSHHKQLAVLRYNLPVGRVGAISNVLLDYVNNSTELSERANHVVDAHGDLRPEHIYLGKSIQIIDCLEFEAKLRELDPVDELAFLALECTRLGASHVGRAVLRLYRSITGDRASSALIAFYQAHRALTRAVLAIWHLDDPSVPDRQHWYERALIYIGMAEHASKSLHAK
ncbi:MAG: hypothetical protein QM709_12435 [Spongiibacteraceae bacterium]